MLHFSKSKIFTIIAVCILALLYAAPSFMPKNTESRALNELAKILPSQKVNLGLDLRGGSHLMMEVDFDYYMKEQMVNLRNEIKSNFRDESIRAIPEIIGSKISFYLNDKDQMKLAKKIIKKMDFADAQRSLQLLRGKANEIEVLILILFLLIIIFDDYNTHIIIYNNHNYYPSL